MITAHSGCDRTGDNSLEFIRYALARNVGGVEVEGRKNSRGGRVPSPALMSRMAASTGRNRSPGSRHKSSARMGSMRQ